MTATLHVVGCPHCRTLWVSNDYRSHSRSHSQETITCPAYETSHDTTRVRSFATADEWPEARQLRSRILIYHSDAEDVSYLATHTQADNQLRQDDQFYSASEIALLPRPSTSSKTGLMVLIIDTRSSSPRRSTPTERAAIRLAMPTHHTVVNHLYPRGAYPSRPPDPARRQPHPRLAAVIRRDWQP